MKLQEHIRKVLKEDGDKNQWTTIIKNVVEMVTNQEERICGIDIITPSENKKSYYYLDNRKVPYTIYVYYIGGPRTKYWPRTQKIFDDEMNFTEELYKTIRSYLPGVNFDSEIKYVNDCEEYKELINKKYGKKDIKEHIRKVLMEEFPQEDYSNQSIKNIRAVGTILKSLYPNFNIDGVYIKKRQPLFWNGFLYEYFDNETNEKYGDYNPTKKELWIDKEIYYTLDDYLGEDAATYVVDWFNNEFDTEAEYVTF